MSNSNRPRFSIETLLCFTMETALSIILKMIPPDDLLVHLRFVNDTYQVTRTSTSVLTSFEHLGGIKVHRTSKGGEDTSRKEWDISYFALSLEFLRLRIAG